MSQTAVHIFLVSVMVGLVVGDSSFLLLDDGYDKNLLPPSPDGAPLDISGVMNLRNILEVEEQMQQITLEVTLRFYWKDSRVSVKEGALKGKKEYLDLVKNEDYEMLWLPDIFIDQAIDIRNPRYLIDTDSVRIYGNGTVSYAQRMNFDVTCSMDFRKFPFDTQTCDIILHSFAYTTDDYTLRWVRKADNSVTSYINEEID